MEKKSIDVQVMISAKPDVVWDALTNPILMKQWMGDEELQLEVETDWKIGNDFVTRGFHHVKFENKGKILQFIPNQHLVYTHLSSISNLEDQPKNYSVFEFNLSEIANTTLLKLTITNFPTESIFKHLELYWRGTLVIIKEFIEESVILKLVE